MMRSALFVLSLGLVVACGEVSTGTDAGGGIDAPVAVDGPAVDGTPVDAEIDAVPIDAAPSIPFDIAYTSIWDIKGTTNIGAGSTGVIINRGTAALDLSQLVIVDFSDDHPTITFTPSLSQATYLLPPNNSGGSLSPLAGQLIDPMVPEFRFDSSSPNLGFSVAIPAPIPTVTVNATVRLRLGAQQAVLAMRFNVAGTGSSTILAAARVSSTPM